MRFAIDAETVSGLGALVGGSVVDVGPVDLAPIVAAVIEAMPGSLSAQTVGVVADLQCRLQETLAMLQQEGGRLRLAAEQYAAADRVVVTRTALGVSATPFGGPDPGRLARP